MSPRQRRWRHGSSHVSSALLPRCKFKAAVAPLNSLLAGDVLEQAVLLSVKARDDKAVEHNYQQLKTYYADGR